MQTGTLLIFAMTVLPLVCTPGPDILFVASQGLSGGTSAAMRANTGVILGYVMHGVLSTLGVAAVVAASPVLFELMRWAGVVYLAYLALRLIQSAMRSGQIALTRERTTTQIRRGFLTSFLNPKGLLVYFAILPNFIKPEANVALQAVILSAIFVALCAIVYGLVGAVVSAAGRRGNFSERRRRWVEGASGALLIVAAARLATGK
ncbi:LysE family translocator [Caldimonas brevitalea]|uniref:Amino acid transporter n=1 Tax=Caldimonas brevitalea TaxID=413882 RepID=A0A0G3BCM0_9BURK|nr:LysE family translocator [Caldimonas brevitalea]AKJ27119.1 amino acid transporter [Caldimonas brevitalea]